METLNLDFVDGRRPFSGKRMSNGRWPSYKPMMILHQEAKLKQKQALCRERMSMSLEDFVQQRIDEEDHERDVEWLRENCDWQF